VTVIGRFRFLHRAILRDRSRNLTMPVLVIAEFSYVTVIIATQSRPGLCRDKNRGASEIDMRSTTYMRARKSWGGRFRQAAPARGHGKFAASSIA
jgi:hypothetical protein